MKYFKFNGLKRVKFEDIPYIYIYIYIKGEILCNNDTYLGSSASLQPEGVGKSWSYVQGILQSLC